MSFLCLLAAGRCFLLLLLPACLFITVVVVVVAVYNAAEGCGSSTANERYAVDCCFCFVHGTCFCAIIVVADRRGPSVVVVACRVLLLLLLVVPAQPLLFVGPT